MSPLTPIQRFLGLPAGADGPFELLGLSPEACDERAVRDALARRLSRLASHPQGAGHEAGEVRLALHTAAAQLMDPAVRAHLASAARARAGAVRVPAPPPVRPPGAAAVTDHAVEAFRAAALPVLIGARGLNRASRRLLFALAHAHGLDAAAIRRALRPAAPAPATVPAPALPARAPRSVYAELGESLEHEGERVRRRARAAALGAALAVALVIVGVFGFLAVVRQSAPRETPTQAPGPAAPRAELPPPAPVPPRARAAPIPAPARIIEDLRAARRAHEKDPGDAAWRFEQAAEAFASSWTRFERAQLLAAQEATVDFVLTPPAESASFARALAAVSAGARRLAEPSALGAADVGPGAWSVGMLMRLSRESGARRALGAEARNLVVRALGPAGAPGEAKFEAGAEAALGAIAARLPLSRGPSLGEAEAGAAWSEWIACALALPVAPERRQAALLDAAERVLRARPSASTNNVARAALDALLSRLDWSTPGAGAANPAPTPAQLRLFAWFDDAAIDPADLSIVTAWLASPTGPTGVTSGMRLTWSADRAERARLRAEYERLWTGAPSIPGVANRPQVESWARAARSELTHAPRSASVVEALASAALFARLNEAAMLRWRGDLSGAVKLVDELADPVNAALRPSVPIEPSPGVLPDGKWALDFLNAQQSLSERLDLISRLEKRAGAIGPIDAGILAEAALVTPQEQVRERATRIILAHADEPVVIGAVLEALPAASRRPQTAELIESLTGARLPPDLRSPEWPAVARRAVVARLMERLARAREAGAADRLARVLERSYRARAGALDASPADAPPDPDAPARSLFDEWRRQADRFGVDPGAERRLAGRARLVRGPVQRFAATQVSVAEAMGAVVGAERPSRAASVRQILSRMAADRRAARHVGEQIESVERAILRLWMIRLGAEEEPAGA